MSERNSSLIKWFLALTSLLLLSPFALAAQPKQTSKIEFEREYGAVVWDTGTDPNFIDAKDNLTNIHEECSLLDDKDSPQRILQHKQDMKLLSESEKELLRRIGNPQLSVSMNIVSASVGTKDSPIYLLFPEVHLGNPTHSLGSLHNSRAEDLYQLTHVLVALGLKIINTDEGSQGNWHSELDLKPKTEAERAAAKEVILEKKWISASQLIGEIYRDKVPVQYNDSDDLIVKNILDIVAYSQLGDESINMNNRWSKAQIYMYKNFPVRSKAVNLQKYKEYFMKVAISGKRKIEQEFTALCEQRSQEMFRYSAELAKSEGAQIIYMSFGAQHTHGILRAIQDSSASSIVFSPNYGSR